MLAMLAFAFPGFAADMETSDRAPKVRPDATVGHGKYTVRRQILDPVSGKPWANKRYRLLIYRDGRETLEYRGRTDPSGHTATVHITTEPEAADVWAVPAYGHGGMKVRLALVTHAGDPKAHEYYLMTLGDGTAFSGRTDAQGHTAQIFKTRPLSVKVTLLGSKVPGHWQKEAAILNRTITAPTVEKRMDAYEQLLALNADLPAKADPAIPLDPIMDSMVRLAAQTGPHRLKQVAGQYLQHKIEAGTDHLPDGPDETTRKLQTTIEACTKLLTLLAARPGVPDGIFSKFVDRTAGALTRATHAGIPLRGYRILQLDELLARKDRRHAAARIFDASRLLEQTGTTSGRSARTYALAALLAHWNGQTRLSRKRLSIANVLDLLNREPDENDEDALAFYHQRLDTPQRNRMWVDAGGIRLARSVCLKAGRRDIKGFRLHQPVNDIDSLSEAWSARAQALDALLSSGRLEPGAYGIRTSACPGPDRPIRVDVSRSDIASVKHARLLPSMIYFGPIDETMRRFDTPSQQRHLKLATLVFLRHAKLEPGSYPINKLGVVKKLHIPF